MAEGYLIGFLIGKAEIYSAGVENHTINKNAIKIMKDDGVDISQNESNHISEFEKIDFDFICLLYTSPSPRDSMTSRMPSSA